jgi:hypothetical protein
VCVVAEPASPSSRLEKRQEIVSRARDAARMLYQSYVELVHECRLKLEISTIEEL